MVTFIADLTIWNVFLAEQDVKAHFERQKLEMAKISSMNKQKKH